MSTATAPAPAKDSDSKNGNGNTTVIAKPKPTTLKGWLQDDAFKEAVAEALPRHCTADRFIRAAITALTRVPKLAECEPAGFLNAMITLSQYGLEPDGRRAHLIPFRDNRRNVMTVQLIIDFKGLAELVMRSGVVSYIHADVVCENDVFEHDKGEIQKHKIDFKRERGAVYAAYALCRFKDGTEKAEVMTRHEIEGIRSRSKAGKSGPWVADWNEMAKKTAFRRLSKWLPLSSEIREAVHGDDDVIETEVIRRLPPIARGDTKSDQLADLLAQGAETFGSDDDDGNASGGATGEESQVVSGDDTDTTPGGGQMTPTGTQFLKDIRDAAGDREKLNKIGPELVKFYKRQEDCPADPEAQAVYGAWNEAIEKAGKKK